MTTTELSRPFTVTIFNQDNGSTITDPFEVLQLVQKWLGQFAYVLFAPEGSRSWLVSGSVKNRDDLEAEIREHGIVQDMVDQFVFTARF